MADVGAAGVDPPVPKREHQDVGDPKRHGRLEQQDGLLFVGW